MILKHRKESYGYLLKDIGEPTRYLEADVGKHTGVFVNTWFILTDSYVNNAITILEEKCYP